MLNPDNLNLNQLAVFHRVVECGSLTKASEELKLSVSTVSEHVKNLESSLEHELFNREGKRIFVNEVGRRVYRHTGSILEASTKITSELGSLKDDGTQIVDIGITPELSKPLGAEILKPLLTNTKIRPRVREARLVDLLRAVRSLDVQVILATEPLDEYQNQDLVSQFFRKNRYVFVGATKYRGLAAGFPESLDKAKFCNYTISSNLRWQLDNYFSNLNISPDYFGEIDEVTLQLEVALSGHGIALLPESVVRKHLQKKMLVEIGVFENYTTDIHFIYRKTTDTRVLKSALDALDSGGES